MIYQHKKLAQGHWFTLNLFEQLANIGSEVERAIAWRIKKREYSQQAFFRALELLELTLSDHKNKKPSRLRELTRLKEVLIDFFYCDNQFLSSDELLRKYFYTFGYAARLKRAHSKVL